MSMGGDHSPGPSLGLPRPCARRVTGCGIRRPFLGRVLGAWFFLILAPTSSIFPIADVAFEHRMYLPLATVVVLVVVGGHEALEYVFRRLPAPDARLRWLELGLATAAILALASATARRNEDYRSD